MALLEGGNIANIERVEIKTEEDSAKTYVFETASSATFTAATSAGEEKEQRVKNTIMGLLRTEDLVKGYDIEMSDQRLIGDVLALIDGGTLTGEGDEWTKYTAPVAGTPVARKAFTMTLYTSDRDTNGGVVSYYKWTFPSCKGAPVSPSITDNDFSTLSYTIKSRPKKGASPMTLEKVEELPSVV